MNYILNTDRYLYYDLEDWIEALEAGDTGDTYLLLFIYPIEDLFEKIKRRTAMRGKLARDKEGVSQTENFQITEDERDLFLDWLSSESAMIFQSISGYSKQINAAYRFNVNFGDPEIGGSINSVSPDGLTLESSVTDMTVNEYQGMKIVITSPGLLENEERTIASNTADEFVITEAFPGDVTGLDFVVSAQTEKHICIYSAFDVEAYDTNMLAGQDALFEKAFISAVMKEWYKLNRFMDDYVIEEKDLANTMSDLRMHFFQRMKSYDRSTQMFNDNDLEDE